MKRRINRPPPWLVGQRVAVLDLETTGHEFRSIETNGFEERKLEPEHGHIVQIAIIHVEDIGGISGETHFEWESLVKPQGKLRNGHKVTIPKSTEMIHGISQADVEEQPTFQEIVSTVVDRLRGAIVIGYNARRFDIPILNVELRRAGSDFRLDPDRCVDVMMRMRALDGWDGKGKGRGTLTSACDRWGAEVLDAHQAAADCRMTWDLLSQMTHRTRFTSGKGHPVVRGGPMSEDLDEYLGKQNAFAKKDEESFQRWIEKKRAAAKDVMF